MTITGFREGHEGERRGTAETGPVLSWNQPDRTSIPEVILRGERQLYGRDGETRRSEAGQSHAERRTENEIQEKRRKRESDRIEEKIERVPKREKRVEGTEKGTPREP